MCGWRAKVTHTRMPSLYPNYKNMSLQQSSRQDKLVELNSRATHKQISVKASASGQPLSSGQSAFSGESASSGHSSLSSQSASESHSSLFSQSSSSASSSSSLSSSLSESEVESIESARAEKELLESNQVSASHTSGLKAFVSSATPCRAAKCSFEDGQQMTFYLSLCSIFHYVSPLLFFSLDFFRSYRQRIGSCSHFFANCSSVFETMFFIFSYIRIFSISSALVLLIFISLWVIQGTLATTKTLFKRSQSGD